MKTHSNHGSIKGGCSADITYVCINNQLNYFLLFNMMTFGQVSAKLDLPNSP